MVAVDLKVVFVARLNETVRRQLEAAAVPTLAHSHYSVELEHLLQKLVEGQDTDIGVILSKSGVNAGHADDGLRRSAWEAAQKTTFRTPETWGAVGAFWSGGSLAPADQPAVPPAPHPTGVAVSLPAARIGGQCVHGGALITRFLTVLIGP